MSISKFTCLVLIVLAVTMSRPPVAESTVTCSQVTTSVLACLSYLKATGPLTRACCRNIKALADVAKTTLDRRTICSCLKSASSHVSGINFRRANSLSPRCRVRIPYNISPSIDCSRVKLGVLH